MIFGGEVRRSNQTPDFECLLSLILPSLNASAYTPVLLTWVKDEESAFCRGTQSVTNIECDVIDLDNEKRRRRHTDLKDYAISILQ